LWDEGFREERFGAAPSVHPSGRVVWHDIELAYVLLRLQYSIRAIVIAAISPEMTWPSPSPMPGCFYREKKDAKSITPAPKAGVNFAFFPCGDDLAAARIECPRQTIA